MVGLPERQQYEISQNLPLGEVQQGTPKITAPPHARRGAPSRGVPLPKRGQIVSLASAATRAPTRNIMERNPQMRRNTSHI